MQAVDYQKLSGTVLPPVPTPRQRPPPEPKGYNPDAEKAALKASMHDQISRPPPDGDLFDFSSMQPAEQFAPATLPSSF